MKKVTREIMMVAAKEAVHWISVTLATKALEGCHGSKSEYFALLSYRRKYRWSKIYFTSSGRLFLKHMKPFRQTNEIQSTQQWDVLSRAHSVYEGIKRQFHRSGVIAKYCTLNR